MSYPRESKEFVPLDIEVLGVQQTSTQAASIEYSILADAWPVPRPVTWVAVGTLATAIGFLIGPGTANDFSVLTAYPATYRVWAQVTDSPEIPVIDCGTIQID